MRYTLPRVVTFAGVIYFLATFFIKSASADPVIIPQIATMSGMAILTAVNFPINLAALTLIIFLISLSKKSAYASSSTPLFAIALLEFSFYATVFGALVDMILIPLSLTYFTQEAINYVLTTCVCILLIFCLFTFLGMLFLRLKAGDAMIVGAVTAGLNAFVWILIIIFGQLLPIPAWYVLGIAFALAVFPLFIVWYDQRRKEMGRQLKEYEINRSMLILFGIIGIILAAILANYWVYPS